MSGKFSRDERRLAGRAGWVSLGVLFSRVTGLVREQVLAFLFPTRLLDAFYAAYTFPNTLRELLGEGALSKAFIATFARVDQNQGPDAAHRLFDRILRALLPAALLVSVLGVVFAPELVDFVFSRGAFHTSLPERQRFGFDTPRELAVWLTRLMFPFLFFVALAALFMSGLHARSQFFLPGLAATFFNVTVIVFGIVGFAAAPELGLHPMSGLAIGVPAGGVVLLLVQALWFGRSGYRPRRTGGPRAVVRDPAFRRVCRLFAPAAAAAGSLQFNVVISRHFASAGTSWLAWFAMSYRLVQFPAGLINVAISSATLPSLTRSAARGDPDGFDRMLGQSVRLMAILACAAGAGLLAIAEPLVSLIYRRGAFTPSDSAQVAAMLSIFVLGLPAFGLTKLLSDAFFAIGTTRPPLAVAAFGVASTWITTRSFVATAGFGHLGLPLATVSVAWLQAVLLTLLLAPRLGVDRCGRRRWRALSSEMAGVALRAVPVALVTGAAARGGAELIRGRLGGGSVELLSTILFAVAAGASAWVVTVPVIAPREWVLIRDPLMGLIRRLRSGSHR